ncbi:MAG: guanylate kinase [Armatimonadota bacterium]
MRRKRSGPVLDTQARAVFFVDIHPGRCYNEAVQYGLRPRAEGGCGGPLGTMSLSKRGLLFVLSAPSGAGKDTLLRLVLRECPDLHRCVTVTTRPRRDTEVDGVDYHFVTPEEFHSLRERGDLLEWAEVFGNLYGTPRRPVEENLAAGRDVILKIDVQGGCTVKRLYPDAVLIFVAPPSIEEQEKRLRQRDSEDEDDLRRRLAAANVEMAHIPLYDYLIVNDDLGKAAGKLRCIITAERCRVRLDQKHAVRIGGSP